LAVLAASKAALGLAAALLSFMQLAATGRADLLRPTFDPEAPAAALAALGAVAHVRVCRASEGRLEGQRPELAGLYSLRDCALPTGNGKRLSRYHRQWTNERSR
jgi:hypothetical protein